MRAQAFSALQKLGQSLMVPVSVLPAAGLIVALGRYLMDPDKAQSWTHALGQVLYSGGLAIFEQLPVVFAVGVAIGFANGAGIAALSAVVGYFTFVSLLKVIGEIRQLELAINMGVFGGIVIGFTAAWLYKRFQNTELPRVLGFFSGKRLVSILVVFASIFLAIAFSLIWPPLQIGINQFGEWVMNNPLGPAFYAAGKRLLIPVGLHHVYYQPFLFQFGEFTSATGTLVHGDSARYFAGDPTAGTIMASEFPIMLFGLPAAALAIVLRARPERRKAIAGMMLTAALTSILTGITEPIEFAFIFVAPLLFVLHVVLAFCSGLLTHYFDLHLGYTFSASLIDFVLGYFNQKNSFYLWAVIGPLIAALYFVGFYTLIGIFKFKTPGREDETMDDAENFAPVPKGNEELAQGVLVALGGTKNIQHLEACITRLRVTVHNSSEVNQTQLKRLGAAGIFHDGKSNFQVVYGTKSDIIKNSMLQLMKSGATDSVGTLDPLTIYAPIKGRVLPLREVPDKTFSKKVLGDGLAIEPTEGVVRAPFDGTVVQLFRTGHAIGLESQSGIELLIHVGIDTVHMQGKGFKSLVQAGDKVKKGQALLEFDLDLVKANAPSIITPIVVTNIDNFKGLEMTSSNQVSHNDWLLKAEK